MLDARTGVECLACAFATGVAAGSSGTIGPRTTLGEPDCVYAAFDDDDADGGVDDPVVVAVVPHEAMAKAANTSATNFAVMITLPEFVDSSTYRY